MLDGKFSVYNGNGSPQGGAPPVKGPPAPINFKFESVESSRLSFDDELRLAMNKFHKSKEPSPAKEMLKTWYKEGPAKWFKFLDIKIELPKAPPKEAVKAAPKKFEFPKLPNFDLDAKLERISKRFEERVEEWHEKLKEKKEDLTEYLWEKIPHEAIAEMVQFIIEIPQHYLLPAYHWLASFIPKEAIQMHFRSGVEKITRFAKAAYGYAEKGYAFCERHITTFAKYINRTIVLPVANFLEKIFRAIWAFLVRVGNWLYPHLKRAGLALYRLSIALPQKTWNFLKSFWKGLKRLTVWLVE